MSADAAAGRPAKRSNWGTAGSRWWPKPRAWGSGRFAVGVKNCATRRRRRVLPAGGFGTREAGANRSRPMILPWSPRWKRWWTRRHGAIRCRRCAGPVRAPANWPRRLRGTRKTLEGAAHPDRDAQFRSINRCVKVFQRAGQPVISVDAKKKELVGPFANGGRDYQPQGQPERVRTHDFPDKHLGKICPYGVYDPTHNCGCVSVGIDHDTAQFAVASIRRWWWHMGKVAYPQAHAILITADGGGSNASRNRLWKVELQQLADEIGIAIYVRHFPPGTSKWNKIEHRMFCHITENWRGRPLISHEVVVNLIGHTTTNTGLTIQAELDKNAYPTGIKVSSEDMKRLNLSPAKFHGKDWNYAIKPRQQRS